MTMDLTLENLYMSASGSGLHDDLSNFSKVCLLLNALSKMTMELTFENLQMSASGSESHDDQCFAKIENAQVEILKSQLAAKYTTVHDNRADFGKFLPVRRPPRH